MRIRPTRSLTKRVSPITLLQRRRRARRAGVAAIGAVIAARRTAKIARKLARRMR